MPRCEQFTVELDSTPVRGRLDLPDKKDGQGPLASVMLCSGLPAVGAETRELYAQLVDALVAAGLAVATITDGSISSPDAKLAVESVDDAAAVFHGLSVRDDLDLNRIGILAHSVGGITASCLARRTDQIHRICLLAPVTAHEIASRLNGGTDDELATRLGGDRVPPGYFDGIEALRPTEDLAATDRPTLIMHGAADRIAQPELSLAYRDAVASAGHQVEHVLVGRGDHLFANGAARSACMDKVTRFFAESAGTGR
jgi:pimeloyl-ACP methyl ester carboxylesterase